jgi:hypothetical protein
MADEDKDKDKDKSPKNPKPKKNRKKYIVPLLVIGGTLSVSKVAFASTNT